MNTIRAIGQNELSLMKLSEITDHYNRVAKAIGLKAVKKFRDKDTAIARTLDAQETYAEDQKTLVAYLDEKYLDDEAKELVKVVKEESDSTRQNKFGLTLDSVVGFNDKCEPKEGTIEHSIRSAMFEFYDADENKFTGTVADIIDYISMKHHRPRSEQGSNEQYVIHNIKWFIKKGHFEVIK